MDVRAPLEFTKGAFPHAQNLPLMQDREREQVGTCYKQHGQEQAIALGNKLVSGKTRDERIAAWADFVQSHPKGYIYCLRGGLRSKITQQWLKDELGIDYPRVQGGYKALRNFLVATTEDAVAQCDFVILGGLTGCGKTELLTQLDNAIDFEGHAHHRGSSFGKHATPQPSQINFENAVAIDLLRKRARGLQQFVLEDESRLVGSCSLPLAMYQHMQHYPLVWLEDSLDGRIQRILCDYVRDLSTEFIALYGPEAGFAAYSQRLRLSLKNITKRLGAERYQRLATLMDQALLQQEATGAIELHRGWIAGLLGEYYDPLYLSQRENRGRTIEFSGDQHAVMDYLRHRLTQH